ncbi:MAG: sulfotransferase family protein [Hydrococcus sp. Prado102]|jgi:hypothetical protein|nr:sulfotransferase family protein [Hydrococcus sp. Prado102]
MASKISFDRKFIFVHISKVAGVSIANAITKYCYQVSIINKIAWRLHLPFVGAERKLDRLLYHRWGHAYASELKEFLGEEEYNKFFKFAFVRNPFDRELSDYLYILGKPSHYLHKTANSLIFEDFLKWRIENDLILQSHFVYDRNGSCLVDEIGHYENLIDDFKKILSKLNIEAELPHKNQSSRSKKDSKNAKLLKYYNSKAIDILTTGYSDDFKNFGYDLEPPI